MALPAIDDFDRADGTLITGNWSAPASAGGGTSWSISANRAQPSNSATDCLAYWNEDVFGNDQYAQYIFATSGGLNYLGPAVRITGAGNGYGFYQEDNTIYRFDAGVKTAIGTVTATWTVGDLVWCGVVGDIIVIYQNDDEVGRATDATYASGSAGLVGYPGVGNSIDNWEGGNIGGGGGTEQPILRRYGGTPFVGGVKFRLGHIGGVWGRGRSGLIVPQEYRRAA